MKRITMLASALLLTGLLAAPVLAENQGNKSPQPSAQAEQAKLGKGQPESEGRALHKAYFQKREAMKKYRDEMLKVRAKNAQ